jgi:hypothetical protein
MTKTELKPLYAEAAARARSTPSASELAVWFSYLGNLDIRDLKSAIDEHFAKSQWMPKESELKPLAEQARRSRSSQSSGRTTYARWRCPDHGIIVGDFIVPTDHKSRRCRKKTPDTRPNVYGPVICGALMHEIFREDNFTTGIDAVSSAA